MTMAKLQYESPDMDIRLFEIEDIISVSVLFEEIPGDGVVDDDEW